MNLECKSGQRLLEERFIERNLCGINVIGEIFDFNYGIESRYALNRMNIVLFLQVIVDYVRLWV